MTIEKVNELLVQCLADMELLGSEGKEAEKDLAYIAGLYDFAYSVKIAIEEEGGE